MVRTYNICGTEYKINPNGDMALYQVYEDVWKVSDVVRNDMLPQQSELEELGDKIQQLIIENAIQGYRLDKLEAWIELNKL